MEIQIKKADITDLDLLVEMRMETLREVFPASKCYFRDDLEEQNRNYYSWALPAGKHIACFARTDDDTVGCGGLCLYQEMPSPDNPDGQCAYLMNIYCRPAYRRHGVGEAVVRWLVGQARQRHITKIYLETSDTGRNLYEKLGFHEMRDMMILPRNLN